MTKFEMSDENPCRSLSYENLFGRKSNGISDSVELRFAGLLYNGMLAQFPVTRKLTLQHKSHLASDCRLLK